MTLTVQLEEVEQDRQAGRMLEACIRADTAASSDAPTKWRDSESAGAGVDTVGCAAPAS